MKFGKIQFEIWANTFWNWLHGLSAPPSPAFTLYRVTSVIGSPSIKSLLNLIATIPTIFFSAQLLNFVWDEIWLDFPQSCKISLKSLVEIKTNLQISQDWPLTATLELSFYSWIKTNHQSVYTLCHIFRSYGSLLNFYLCIVWGVLTDGRGGTSAIYRWEKLFWEINLFIPFPPILELIGFSGHQLDILILPPIISDSPRLIVYLHDHHDQSSYCPSSCQTWPNDHW